MTKEFWSGNLFELQRYKNLSDIDSLVERSNSFINYIKEIFPVNSVPEKIEESLRHLEQRIHAFLEQYEISVERVCLEIQVMIEKGDLK